MPRTWVDVLNEALEVTGGTTPADTHLFSLVEHARRGWGFRAVAAATGVPMPGFEAPTPTPSSAPAAPAPSTTTAASDSSSATTTTTAAALAAVAPAVAATPAPPAAAPRVAGATGLNRWGFTMGVEDNGTRVNVNPAAPAPLVKQTFRCSYCPKRCATGAARASHERTHEAQRVARRRDPFSVATAGAKRKVAVVDYDDDKRARKRATPWWPSGIVTVVTPTAPTAPTAPPAPTTAKTTTPPSAATVGARAAGGGASGSSNTSGGAASGGGGDDDDDGDAAELTGMVAAEATAAAAVAVAAAAAAAAAALVHGRRKDAQGWRRRRARVQPRCRASQGAVLRAEVDNPSRARDGAKGEDGFVRDCRDVARHSVSAARNVEEERRKKTRLRWQRASQAAYKHGRPETQSGGERGIPRGRDGASRGVQAPAARRPDGVGALALR